MELQPKDISLLESLAIVFYEALFDYTEFDYFQINEGVILVALLMAAFINDFFAVVYTVCSSIVISAYFFKYQFKQINRQISKVIKDKQPISKLKHLISLHNSIILEVEEYNSEVKYYLIILVKLIKPGFNTFVYLLFDSTSQWYLRVYVVITMTGMALFFIGMTGIFASASKFAHRPQFAFYSLLLSRDHNQKPLSLNNRYKLKDS